MISFGKTSFSLFQTNVQIVTDFFFLLHNVSSPTPIFVNENHPIWLQSLHWGHKFDSGLNFTVEEGPGADAGGAQAKGTLREELLFRGCFREWFSCEDRMLYCLGSGDLIYQNEVIHPTREDKPSFQRINQAHQGPPYPLICSR